MRERRCKQRLYGKRFSEAAASYRSVGVVRSCKELSAESSRGRTITASLSSGEEGAAMGTVNPASPGLAQFGAVSFLSPEPPESRTMAAHSCDRRRRRELAGTFVR